MKTPRTICRNCQHFSGGMQWDEQFCLASPIKKRIDFVTGWPTPEENYMLAREVNTDGECELYEARKTIINCIGWWTKKEEKIGQ